PDPPDHHPPELLPHVRQARRHDRYGVDRGRRIRPHLHARRRLNHHTIAHTYGLEVVSIPTNRAMIRAEEPDLIYKTEAAKFDALADDIAERHREREPVLAGTTSVEKPATP